MAANNNNGRAGQPGAHHPVMQQASGDGNSRSHRQSSSNDGREQDDNSSLTWSRVTPMSGSALPPPRSGAASVVVKGRLYMFGGYGGGTGRLDDFYSFSFDTCTWEEVEVLSSEKPGCRENNGVVIGDSSRVYLFGGYNGTAWLNDLWMFDIDTQRWECIQESSDPSSDDSAALGIIGRRRSTAPSRRFGYVSVVHDNKFVLFGGFDGSRWLNDMYEFDFLTKVWTQIEARGRLPSVRSCPAWAKDDTHVYIQGGYDGMERKADFFACNLSDYTWHEMPCNKGTPPSPRYFHSCCLYGNKMYAYGGYSGSERLADMYAYDFETGHWSEVDCSGGYCPSGRSSLVAQVYQNCLYIFGGYNGLTVLNDFYKFRLVPVSIPPPVLVDDLYRLINNSEHSDITFLVEGKNVHANRAILSVRSEYFKVMLFSGGMRESIRFSPKNESNSGNSKDGGSHNNSNCDDGSYLYANFRAPPIELKDVHHDVFLKVLEYLYTDTVRDVPLEIGMRLMILSERFMLDRLKSICEDHIRRDISVNNVIGIYIASYRHNATGLKDIALEFILKNLQQPAIIEGLSDLKLEPDLLVEIIKRKAVTPVCQDSQSGGGPFGSSSEWSGTRR